VMSSTTASSTIRLMRGFLTGMVQTKAKRFVPLSQTIEEVRKKRSTGLSFSLR
jgi:hypothetical protein